MTEELISVVVPIYNVEKYLPRCVDSILNQTYQNLQIILVDDGATDSSGKICDSYTSDHRVSVIHKENGGLSSARNAALPYLKGKYVTFIDSDDWVTPDFIEALYENAITAQAEVSATGYYIAPEDGEPTTVFDGTKQVMDSAEALGTFLLHDGLGVTVWGKLYLTTLWDNVRCPEGKLHEDQYTTYKLLDLANKIVFDSKPRYYYFQRSNSIGHSAFSDRSYDLYNGVHEEYDFISQKYPEVIDLTKLERDIWEVVFVNMMLRSNVKDDEVIRSVRKHIKEDMNLIKNSSHLSKVRKIQLWLFSKNLVLYKKAYLKYVSK